MQWQRSQTIILFVLGLILVAFLARPARSINPAPHMIVALQPTQPPGSIKIKRATESDYKPAFIGAVLAGADRILLAQDALAEIMCQNLDSWRPPGGKQYQVSEGCGGVAGRGFLPIDDETRIERSINAPDIPYLITPRNTALLPLRGGLILKWNSVPEASTYQVQLIGPGVNWHQRTRATRLTYRNTNNLKPGARYWLIVTTNLGQDSAREGTVSFTILTSEQAKEARSGERKIEQEQLSPEAEALALARLYQGYDLNQEAIEVLETALARPIESAAIYRLLGDTYRYVGLNRLAVERYQMGISLAQTTGDIESEESMADNLKITKKITSPLVSN